MKIVCRLLWLTLALVLTAWIPVSDCQQCSRRPDLVYQEKGDVTVTVLLDLTYGVKCNKTSATSSQSMHGLLQTLQTLNAIQFLGAFKIGIRVYDTCGQESMALQAVLDTALELNLTYKYQCRSTAHLGFMYPHRSYPALSPLTTVMNAPVTDISQWQGSSPMAAVVDLLSSLKWSSVAVVSQSKQILATFYRKASDKDICIVAQSVLPPNNKAKETTVRVVRRSKRSGSRVYVLIGSAEFLVNLIPYFHSNGSTPSTKYVLIATDSWNANLTQEISSSVQEALIIRPQRILSDDNISARVFYSLMKQYKNHLTVVCQGRIRDCEFEQHHLKKLALGDDDLNILKLSKDMAIYNEQFPVTYILNNGTSVDIGSIYEEKFIPINNSITQEIEAVECDDCLCTNVDAVSTFVFQLRTELLLMVAAGISVLGILLSFVLFGLMLKTQCSSDCEDRSGNFIFPMMFTILLLFLVSFLYVLVPSSILCLARAISLSGVYTIFLAHLFSVTTTTFVVHPTTRNAGHIVQILLFFFIISVQVPVLTYETLFRDETLLTNKILTDYGPKIECTLDDVLSFKLFLYPATLLAMQMIASIAILVHHWKVKAIKIKLAIGSLLVVAVNVAWGACYFYLEKQWRDLVILSGLQSNGFMMMLAVVIPKIVFNVNNNRQSFRAKGINHLGRGEQESASPGNRNLHPGHPSRTQHIYAIPSHEADRSSIIESEREFNTAM